MDLGNLMNNGMNQNRGSMGMMNNTGNMGMNMNMNRAYVPYAPRYEIIRVNGEGGAHNFQMAPNSSQFLLDSSTNNLIWLVQTDGAGYLTATPFDVFPHQVQPPIDINNLESRVKQLEDAYVQFTSGSTKQSKKQRNNTSSVAATNESINSAD